MYGELVFQTVQDAEYVKNGMQGDTFSGSSQKINIEFPRENKQQQPHQQQQQQMPQQNQPHQQPPQMMNVHQQHPHPPPQNYNQGNMMQRQPNVGPGMMPNKQPINMRPNIPPNQGPQQYHQFQQNNPQQQPRPYVNGPPHQPPQQGGFGGIIAQMMNNGPGNQPGGRPPMFQNQQQNQSSQDVSLFKIPPDASDSLCVGGLPKDTSEREIAHIFRPFPGFQRVRLIKNKKGANSYYYGFIDFENSLQSTIACKTLQGYRFDKDDKQGIKISYAYEPKDRHSSQRR
ncbi:hypothetical protein PPERSA_06569 [Pseudocohnilembus persalinus]|uniref:RRM domain-containing protein n=1 Tax=Pseudocohnilembus persalinus TaxID=266149 RepID=A0A0V0QS36_PSEPJ|nr:hypothetical protein PPERSA_06569 [Pseudocohnilembus persalinus]|eukprot:KRX04935.1 hypothetical protein PPERSA_06569 [Pseudocohnilembus persalinus]